MRPGHFQTICWHTLRFVRLVVFVGLLATLLLPFIPLRILPPLGWGIRTFVSSIATVIELILAALLAVIEICQRQIGEPWHWKCVSKILNDFQRGVFDELEIEEVAEDHRVTLYRFSRWNFWPRTNGVWYWPWSGWLIPHCRAGTARKATTVFLAKSGTVFEGVCGAAYFRQAGLLILEAADVPDITANSSDEDIAQYAEKTFVTPASIKRRIRDRRPCARLFMAFRMTVRDAPWGVVMIDSRAERLPKNLVATHKFEAIRSVLGHLLEPV